MFHAVLSNRIVRELILAVEHSVSYDSKRLTLPYVHGKFSREVSILNLIKYVCLGAVIIVSVEIILLVTQHLEIVRDATSCLYDTWKMVAGRRNRY